MFVTNVCRVVPVVACLIGMQVSASAAQVTLEATGDSRGAFNSPTYSALGQPPKVVNDTYQVRTIATGSHVTVPAPLQNMNLDVTRSYHLFDLAAVTGEIVGAELLIPHPSGANPSYDSPDATETVTFYDVVDAASTPTNLRTGNAGAQAAIFADLGAGDVFGSFTASASSNGTVESILLNADAIDSLNAAIGGEWAIGASLTSGNHTGPTGLFERIFRGSSNGSAASQLILTTVPEPSSLVILALGTVAFGWNSRRRVG